MFGPSSKSGHIIVSVWIIYYHYYSWQVEVAFSGVECKEEDVKPETGSSGLKVLPPWMIKQGMNLTKEQRGEVKQEPKMDGSLAAESQFSDDKKSINDNDDNKSLQV